MNYIDDKLTGNMIRQIRKHLGITQQQMAKVICVAPQTISAWELGKRRINTDDARNIFKKFNIDVEQYHQFLPKIIPNTLIKYCRKCGNIFIGISDTSPVCCQCVPSILDQHKKVVTDYTVFIKDNCVNVLPDKKDVDLKYIAYISSNSVDVVKPQHSFIVSARFPLKSGGMLFGFHKKHGLFKVATNLNI